MTGWEYRTVKVKTGGGFCRKNVDEREIDQLLNMMGLDSWELVTATVNSFTMDLLYTFKRPLS